MKKTLSIVLLFASTVAYAQKLLYSGDYSPATRVLVKFDPVFTVPLGDIPFDKIFTIRLYRPKTENLPTFVFLLDGNEKPVSYQGLKISAVDAAKNPDDTNLKNGYVAIDILMPALDPNTDYVLSSEDGGDEHLEIYASIMSALSKNTLKDPQRPFQNTLLSDQRIRAEVKDLLEYYRVNQNDIDQASAKDKKAATETLVEFFRAHPSIPNPRGGEIMVFAGATENRVNTYQSGLETSAAFNLVADAGIVFCGLQKGFTTMVPYVGINYSFRSFDSSVPFHHLKGRLKMYERLAIHAGLTLNSMAKDGYRGNLFKSNNLMIGGGYKFSHVVSVTAGGLLYNKLSPNPLLDDKKLAVVPYFGLSLNLKIKAILGDIAKIFSYAN